MKFKIAIFLIVDLLFFDISAIAGGIDRNVDTIYSVDDVNSKLVNLEGKNLEVIGFMRFGDDESNIWTSRYNYELSGKKFYDKNSTIWNQCIAVNSKIYDNRILRRFNGHYVKIYARLKKIVRREGDVNYSQCSDFILEIRFIDEIELRH